MVQAQTEHTKNKQNTKVNAKTITLTKQTNNKHQTQQKQHYEGNNNKRTNNADNTTCKNTQKITTIP